MVRFEIRLHCWNCLSLLYAFLLLVSTLMTLELQFLCITSDKIFRPFRHDMKESIYKNAYNFINNGPI